MDCISRHIRRASVIHTIQAIELYPSSHGGYEAKHAALHGMGRHSEAFEAFEVMLSNLEQSPDPRIRGELLCHYWGQQSFDRGWTELRGQYVDATATIRNVIQQIIRHMPRVLIDTITGRLYDKAQQAAAFEELPVYDELQSSMTSRLDNARIRREVKNTTDM